MSQFGAPPPPSPVPPSVPPPHGGRNSEASGRGSVANPDPEQGRRRPPVATGGLRGVGYGAIVLAAGTSSRMVENKLLLPWTDSEPIVRHAVSKFIEARIDPIVVVTGRDAELVAASLRGFPLTCVHNPDFAAGEMLSSLKVGLRALPANLAAVFIQPADMPCVPAEVMARLAAAHEPGFNVAPSFEGRRGHPVLLDRAYWGAMLALPAEAKPRDLVEGARERLRLVTVADAGVLLDLDTREAYELALGRGC